MNMKATVEMKGPLRAQLYVEGLAPRFVLVPVGELPPDTKAGDVLELTLRKARGEVTEPLPGAVRASQPMTVEGVLIRAY